VFGACFFLQMGELPYNIFPAYHFLKKEAFGTLALLL